VQRYRGPLAGASALAGLTLVEGTWSWAVAATLFGATWHVAGRLEPVSVRRQRAQARRELPHVVHLLSLALSAGATVPMALRVVEEALPESTTELRAVRGQLELGVEPGLVWSEVARRPELAPLGRALVRAAKVGAAPSAALAQLAHDLAEETRAQVEDRARAVGIKAALPLGLCLLPAFLLIGIAPLVVSTLTALRW
jgi:pilus assembly protein TadC